MNARLTNSVSGLLLIVSLAPTGTLTAQERSPAAVSDALPQLCAPTRVFESAQLSVYAVSPVRKVFANHNPAEWGRVTSSDTIRLSMARNESESFFLVLRPSVALKEVTISFQGMAGETSSRQGGRESTWSYRRVAEVPVKGISRWYGMLGAETGTVPDPLLPGDAFSAPANRNSVLLVEARTGRHAEPGLSSGLIRVHADGAVLASIPVKLTTWDIVLPTRPVLQTLSHNLENSSRASWSFLHDAGVTALKYGPDPPAVRLDKNGKLQVDFRRYKKGLDLVFQELGYDHVLIPPSLLGHNSHLSKSYLGLGLTVGSERFWPVFDQYMKAIGDFYRAHGWSDKVVFYMFDEVNEEHHPLVIKLAKRARLHFPEVRVMVSTHVMSDELAASLDMWCVPWHFFATQVEHIPNWRKWQRDGLELWAYKNSLYILNSSKILGANRFYPSVLAKYGYKGNFWWGIAYNSNKDPWTDLHRHGNQKQGMYGNGLLFYPPRKKPSSEFFPWHSSLRWESYRQGLDEFALMTQMGELLTQLRRSLGGPALKEQFSEQRSMRWWGSLLSSEFRMHTYRPDGEYIHRYRQLIAHELQALRRPPLGMVDVESAGGPFFTKNTVQIRGVCQAGTHVTVAGKPVDSEGTPTDKQPSSFQTTVSLRPGRNLIPIVFDDGRGTRKTMFREVHYRMPDGDQE